MKQSTIKPNYAHLPANQDFRDGRTLATSGPMLASTEGTRGLFAALGASQPAQASVCPRSIVSDANL